MALREDGHQLVRSGYELAQSQKLAVGLSEQIRYSCNNKGYPAKNNVERFESFH